MNETYKAIKEALSEVVAGIDDRELNDEVLLVDLGIDSLKYVEMLVLIEEKFNLMFDESDLGTDSVRSIGDLTNLIKKTATEQAS